MLNTNIIVNNIVENSMAVVPESTHTYNEAVETLGYIKCTGERFMNALNDKKFSFYFGQNILGHSFNRDITKDHLMLIRA